VMEVVKFKCRKRVVGGRGVGEGGEFVLEAGGVYSRGFLLYSYEVVTVNDAT